MVPWAREMLGGFAIEVADAVPETTSNAVPGGGPCDQGAACPCLEV